jgi:heme A synthase
MTRFTRYGWAVLGFNLLVILWGAYVRASGSGAGCGAHWPLCNGVVIPRAPAVETIIELTHRATSGVALLLVVAQLAWARRIAPRRGPLWWAAHAAMALMLTEALVGAGLVLFEMVAENASLARAWWLAAHLLNTFGLLAMLGLVPWLAARASLVGATAASATNGAGSAGATTAGARAGASAATYPFSGALRSAWRAAGRERGLLVVALGGTLLLGMTGAITALGDTLFPSQSLAEGFAQDFSPTAHLLIRLRVIHPTLAVAMAAVLLLTAGVCATRRPSRETRRFGIAVAALVLTQLLAGVVNLVLLAPTWMQLVHLLLADLLWLALVGLAAATLATAPRD